jgi:uncharacterized hydrophobic protein (TIGR00271 family)
MSATGFAAVKQWSRQYFRDREDVYSDIYENRQFNAIYLTMLVMAGLISLLGLLINSPAVIIGAMLISPLMGPILSCGLALTLADWDLGKKGLRNVSLSVVEVLIITALVTTFSPLKDATTEILARSNPNLMDLLIAFFSGVAGSIALTSRSKTGLTIIPGVAIATAVMPPLATTGYGLATAQWQIARGSFMLFFTNLVAIVISADLVFLIAGFRPRQRVARGTPAGWVRARGIIALAILIVISIPLIRTLAQAAQQAQARRQIYAVLKTLERPHAVQLGNWRFDLEKDRVVVDASVTTGEHLDDQVVQQTQRLIASSLGRHAELHLTQIRVDDGRQREASKDFLSGGNLAVPAPPPKPPEEVIGEYQQHIETTLSKLAKDLQFSELNVRAVGIDADRSVTVQVSARRETPVSREVISVLSSALAADLSRPVTLDCNFAIGNASVAFRKDSVRILPASEPELSKLRTLRKNMEGLDTAAVSFPAASPLNERRVRVVATALGMPVEMNIDPKLEGGTESATVHVKQSLVLRSAEASPQTP